MDHMAKYYKNLSENLLNQRDNLVRLLNEVAQAPKKSQSRLVDGVWVDDDGNPVQGAPGAPIPLSTPDLLTPNGPEPISPAEMVGPPSPPSPPDLTPPPGIARPDPNEVPGLIGRGEPGSPGVAPLPQNPNPTFTPQNPGLSPASQLPSSGTPAPSDREKEQRDFENARRGYYAKRNKQIRDEAEERITAIDALAPSKNERTNAARAVNRLKAQRAMKKGNDKFNQADIDRMVKSDSKERFMSQADKDARKERDAQAVAGLTKAGHEKMGHTQNERGEWVDAQGKPASLATTIDRLGPDTIIQGTSMTRGEFERQTGRKYDATNREDSTLVSRLAGAGKYGSEAARQGALSSDAMNQQYGEINTDWAKRIGQSTRDVDKAQIELDRFRNDPKYRASEMAKQQASLMPQIMAQINAENSKRDRLEAEGRALAVGDKAKIAADKETALKASLEKNSIRIPSKTYVEPGEMGPPAPEVPFMLGGTEQRAAPQPFLPTPTGGENDGMVAARGAFRDQERRKAFDAARAKEQAISTSTMMASPESQAAYQRELDLADEGNRGYPLGDESLVTRSSEKFAADEIPGMAKSIGDWNNPNIPRAPDLISLSPSDKLDAIETEALRKAKADRLQRLKDQASPTPPNLISKPNPGLPGDAAYGGQSPEFNQPTTGGEVTQAAANMTTAPAEEMGPPKPEPSVSTGGMNQPMDINDFPEEEKPQTTLPAVSGGQVTNAAANMTTQPAKPTPAGANSAVGQPQLQTRQSAPPPASAPTSVGPPSSTGTRNTTPAMQTTTSPVSGNPNPVKPIVAPARNATIPQPTATPARPPVPAAPPVAVGSSVTAKAATMTTKPQLASAGAPIDPQQTGGPTAQNRGIPIPSANPMADAQAGPLGAPLKKKLVASAGRTPNIRA